MPDYEARPGCGAVAGETDWAQERPDSDKGATMAAEWFYREGSATRGPVTVEELRVLARRGVIDPKTPIRRGTEGSWALAERAKGLFAEATPDPDPPGTAASDQRPNPEVERAPAVPIPPPNIDWADTVDANLSAVTTKVHPSNSPPAPATPQLRSIASILQILGGLTAVAVALGILFRFLRVGGDPATGELMLTAGFFAVIAAATVGVVFFGAAEVCLVLLRIEENTRLTRVAIERLIDKDQT